MERTLLWRRREAERHRAGGENKHYWKVIFSQRIEQFWLRRRRFRSVHCHSSAGFTALSLSPFSWNTSCLQMRMCAGAAWCDKADIAVHGQISSGCCKSWWELVGGSWRLSAGSLSVHSTLTVALWLMTQSFCISAFVTVTTEKTETC